MRQSLIKVSVFENGDQVELTKKEDIEGAIHKENKAKFSQINNSPTIVEPLVSELGFLGNTEAGKAILAGTYKPPPSIDQYSKAYIKALAISAQL